MKPSAEAEKELFGFFKVIFALPVLLMTTYGARTGFKNVDPDEEEEDDD